MKKDYSSIPFRNDAIDYVTSKMSSMGGPGDGDGKGKGKGEKTSLNQALSDVSGKDAESSAVWYSKIENKEERDKASHKEHLQGYNELLKSGEYTTLSSLKETDPETYNFYKLGLTAGTGKMSDDYGEYSDLAVKKRKIRSWSDFYGEPTTFNPEEKYKAAKAGKIEEYEKKNPYPKKDLATGSLTSFGIKYKTKEEKMSEELASAKKLPINKSGIVSSTKSLPNKLAGEQPTDNWVEPTVHKRPKTVERSGGSKGGKKQLFGHTKVGGNKVGKSVGFVAGNSTQGIEYQVNKAILKSEEKPFKAYYGNYFGKTGSEIAQAKDNYKERISENKKEMKEYPLFSERRMGIRELNSDLRKKARSASNAEKFFNRNLQAKSVFNGNNESVEITQKSNAKNKYYTPEIGPNYNIHVKKMSFGRKSK